MTDHEQRALCIRDQPGGALNRIIQPPRADVRSNDAALGSGAFGRLILEFLVLDVLGDVEQNRPRAPAQRDPDCVPHRRRELGHVLHQMIVLRDRQGQPDDVRLLKGVPPNHGARHLSGDGDHRRAVHVRGRKSGHEVRRPGT